MTKAVSQYDAAIRGSIATTKDRLYVATTLGSVKVFSTLVGSFLISMATPLLAIAPMTLKFLKDYNQLSGAMKIDAASLSQIAADFSDAIGSPGPAGMTAGYRVIFQDVARFVAMLRMYREKSLPVPQYLIRGGGPAARGGSRPGACRRT